MNTYQKVIYFEWQYQLRRPATWAFAALMLGQGIWSGIQIARDNLTHQIFINSVVNIYFALSTIGIGLAVVSVLMAGQALTRDVDHRTAPYLYTLPISPQDFFIGRFLGTYLVIVVLAAFNLVGLAFVPWLIPGKVGPIPILAMLEGFLEITVWQLFTLVTTAFSLTVLLRGIRGAYLTLFVVVLYVLLADGPRFSGTASNDWLLLLDPFGVDMLRESIESIPSTSEQTIDLPLPDMLLINRLLWLALSLAILNQALQRFTFNWFSTPTRSQARAEPLANTVREPSIIPELPQKGLLLPDRSFSLEIRSQLWKMMRLSGREFVQLTRQPFFRLEAVLLIILSILFATVLNQQAEFISLPTTARMTAIRYPLSSVLGMLVVITTGELIYRERLIGLADIFDALPPSVGIRIIPKLAALAGGAALLIAIIWSVGLVVQLTSPLPITDINWPLYAQDFILDGWWPLCHLITLASVISVIVNQRLTAHLVSVGLFAGLWISNTIQDEQLLFSFLPGRQSYSELSGYGAWERVRWMVSIVWWGVAGVLVVITLLGWQRGVALSVRQRLVEVKRRLTSRYKLGLCFSLLVVVMGLLWLQWPHNRPISTGSPLQTAGSPAASNPLLSDRISNILYASNDGKHVRVSVVYRHPYQADLFLRAAVAALRLGEEIFGPYPFDELQIREMSRTRSDRSDSRPGQIDLDEDEGWIANPSYPLDYLDYLITREVLMQWLVHGLKVTKPSLDQWIRLQPGYGLITSGLAEYLALQVVQNRYGPQRLQYRLHQRAQRYLTDLTRQAEREPTLLNATDQAFVERDRAALVLTSIGQVMGDSAFHQQIGQFYQRAINSKPQAYTAIEFVTLLNQHLPPSLRYLITYLSHRYWFEFHLGQVYRLPNEVVVEIIANKTEDDGMGNRVSVLINDLVPVVLLDQNGNEVYRQLVRPAPFQNSFRLPLPPNTRQVAVDPLGAWPGTNLYKNRKLF